MNRRAVFLDRDGTINREQSFISRPEDLHVLPGATAAITRIDAAGLIPVVVTNQSGIARGLYSERDLARIHEKTHRETGRLVHAYLHCPHHPDMSGPYGAACDCRKPGSGMLHRAAALFDLALQGSFVVGDSARDVLMARGLPMRTILVRCGKPWREQLAQLEAASLAPDHIADDLSHAVDWILAQPPA